MPTLSCFSKEDQDAINCGHFPLQGSLIFLSHIHTHREKPSFWKLMFLKPATALLKLLNEYQFSEDLQIDDKTEEKFCFVIWLHKSISLPLHVDQLYKLISFLWIHKRDTSKILSLAKISKNIWKHWLPLSILNL